MHPLGDSLQHPLCKLLGFDKELGSIGGLLKVKMAKKIQSEKYIERENLSSLKSETTQNMMMVFKKIQE